MTSVNLQVFFLCVISSSLLYFAHGMVPCSDLFTKRALVASSSGISFELNLPTDDEMEKIPLPWTVVFSSGIKDIKMPSNGVQWNPKQSNAKGMQNATDWLLSAVSVAHLRNDFTFVVVPSNDTADISIMSAKTTDGDIKNPIICRQETEKKIQTICGVEFTKLINWTEANVLVRKANWATGRNYNLKIPSYPDFTGYVVDVFFTEPVENVKIFDPTVRVVRESADHWAFVKEFTEQACIKLVRVFFQVSFKKTSDVRGILLNGKRIFGSVGPSNAILTSNEMIGDAMTTKCESFLSADVAPWFGEEKGLPLWFEATVPVNPGDVGLIVDFIFSEDIKILRLWELRAERLSGNHWRMVNGGWPMGIGTVRFPFHMILFEHYHVNITGIVVNGRPLCGLGLSTVYLPHAEPLLVEDFLSGTLELLKKTDCRIIASVALNGITILLLTVALFVAFFRKVSENYCSPKRRLSDFPPNVQPIEPYSVSGPPRSETNDYSLYGSIKDDSSLSCTTEVSSM